MYETGLNCDEKVYGNYKRLDDKITLKPSDTFERSIKIHHRWWWLYLANCKAHNNKTFRNNLTTIDFELKII